MSKTREKFRPFPMDQTDPIVKEWAMSESAKPENRGYWEISLSEVANLADKIRADAVLAERKKAALLLINESKRLETLDDPDGQYFYAHSQGLYNYVRLMYPDIISTPT